MSVGMSAGFASEDDNNTRCKLAAKISAIDTFIFINRQGVKVIEKTKIRLARGQHGGTVSIISGGLLFSRALESVLSNPYSRIRTLEFVLSNPCSATCVTVSRNNIQAAPTRHPKLPRKFQ